MINKAVRMHAQNDLRLDTFELPAIRDDEILVKIVSDSICMSSYKAAIQGTKHKRVPQDIAEHPPIIGHEFCGVIEQVGTKWADKFASGEKFVIQPAISYHGTQQTPGYAFEYCGGDSQYAILIPEIMEQDFAARIPRQGVLLWLSVRAAELHYRHVPRDVPYQTGQLRP